MTKLNKLFAIEQSALNTTASATLALNETLEAFAGLNKTINEKLKGITDKQLVSIFEGKGKAEGSAFVLHSILTATPWAIRRYVPMIRDYLGRVGLKLDGTAIKSLRVPESITDKSTADDYRAYLATVPFNKEEEEDPRTDQEKAKDERAKKAKIKKEWSGEEGKKRFAQYIVNCSDRLKEKNKTFANDLYLFICNYESIKQTLATLAAEGELNKKLPADYQFSTKKTK